MPTYAKAIASAVSTFLASLAVVLTGPASNFGDVTDGQWVASVSAALAAGLVVYGIRNGVSSDPTTSTPERFPRDAGHFSVEMVLVSAAVAVLVVVGYHLLVR